MIKKGTLISLLCLILSIFVANDYVWASATGLNNIPTADVVSAKTLVWQVYSDVGDDNKPDYFTGFKYGALENLEVGVDGRIFPEDALVETVTFQTKYRFEFNKDLALSLGVSNLGDHSRTGWENPYLVFTYNIGFLRAHLGATFQRDNEGGFVGLDKTFQFLQRDFTLRSDLIQTNDGHDTTASIGFIHDLGYNFLLESWVSFPSQSGEEDIVTIKLNYVIEF